MGQGDLVIFIIFVPYLGVFVYLIARGARCTSTPWPRPRPRTGDAPVHAGRRGSGGSTADELARLADLQGEGRHHDAEFEQLKAKAMA